MQGIKAPDPGMDEQFRDLVEDYQAPLLKMCYLQLQDRGLAEDAVQETFIKAYRTLPAYRGESSRKTWLIRIAINTCRDMQRSGWWKHINRRVTPEMLPELSRGISEDALTVNLEIARLPGKMREVVLLYYYSNMQITEIAEALGIVPSSVSGRLRRAKERLRAALKGAYFDE